MGIKRISELDRVTDDISATFNNCLFEVSQYTGEKNEANSYYASRNITGDMLAKIVADGIKQQIINEIKADLTEINKKLDNHEKRITILENYIGGTTEGTLNLENISCTNLTVLNDINGCCLSAKWL